jgi:hypothetical protein
VERRSDTGPKVALRHHLAKFDQRLVRGPINAWCVA